MRKFVRHPSSIPIELAVIKAPAPGSSRLRNVGVGGFACAVAEPLPVGCSVNLRIPLVWPEYRGCGLVVWCKKTAPAYEVGIQFDARHFFQAKMVEQLAQIEEYRAQAQFSDGRALSSELAAEEWIALHAKEFADSFQLRNDGGGL